jgi:hypothetical protein
MAAFNHVTQIVLANANITKALREDGIKEISGLISLSDEQVEDLTYLDSDPTNPTAYCLKKGEIGLIKLSCFLQIPVPVTSDQNRKQNSGEARNFRSFLECF